MGGLLAGCVLDATATPVPREPVEIGFTTQFFIDDYIVDNRWAVNYNDGSTQMVTRVLHPPQKYGKNPVLAAEAHPNPSISVGWCSVIREPESGRIRMWYQISRMIEEGRARYAVAYAESRNGLDWDLPRLDLFEWDGSTHNNIVWKGANGRGASSSVILEVPEKDRRGYRYLMLYLDGGIHLVGSKDGIRWDKESVVRLARMHSDTLNSIVFDPNRGEYVMFCRAKDRYRVTASKDILETGESRRVARMASSELWTEWSGFPQNILVADELDASSSYTAFYGMPAKVHAGIYWGFVETFKWNTAIEPELAFSRDGVNFQRLPLRPKLIPLGREGDWDDGMVLAPCGWVEMGDEWWYYYSGFDGPHNVKGVPRVGRIGLARGRKEGLVSMRGPENGGVICTRMLHWPGGSLVVNADARHGQLRARVVDERRHVIPGFGYEDAPVFAGNAVTHEITWRGGTLDSLKGRLVRIEFFLRNADIYTFRAAQRAESL